MSKLSRSVIKEIVKECLIEILAEGILPSAQRQKASSPRVSKSRINEVREKRPSQANNLVKMLTSASARRPALDSVSYGQNEQNENASRESAAKQAQSLTSDPVLSSILADTAQTTLLEQRVSSVTGPGGSPMPSTLSSGDHAAKKMFTSDPSEMFGEAASKWADLAFAPPLNKN